MRIGPRPVLRTMRFWFLGCAIAIALAWSIDLVRSRNGPYARLDNSTWTDVPLSAVDWEPQEDLRYDGILGARVCVACGITVKQINDYGGHASAERELVLSGWPLRCLMRREASAGNGLWNDYADRELPRWTRGVIVWPSSSFTLTAPVRKGLVPEWRLALRPIWMGLAIDGAFFGVLAWVMLRGVRAIRARQRGNANRCVACGYDLAGLPAAATCPECAAPHFSAVM